MPADPSEPARGALSPLQRTRVDSARTALQGARAADLAALDAEQLILLVERLRGRLGDVLGILSELDAGQQ